MFSTTVTWNCRGRQMMAVADRKVRTAQRGPKTSPAPTTTSTGTSAKMSANPSASDQVANTPTASSAKSFTTASSAMAATTPWCRSFASRFRVPNRIVNSARPAAIQKAVATPSPSPAMTW